MSHERRAVPRTRYCGEVVASITGDVIICSGIDLSEKGISFSGPARLPARMARETHIVLTFKVPKLRRWLVLEGVVVRVSTDGRRTLWAVRFTDLLPRIGRILRTFVFVGHGEVREFR